jgi:peptidoglycan/xylan/chitin deacetylase (PgdA/CDA1 family)
MTPRRFVEQIDHLSRRGYEFIGEAEFARAVESPAPESSRKLLLTFDDGYEALYELYLRALAPRGIAPLVFLVTDYVGRENAWDLSLGRRPFRHLAWEQIGELSGRGVAFGSHGARHLDLTRLDRHALADELARSKASIEEHIQRKVVSLSYPFGRYNDHVRQAVATAGFTLGFSLYPRHSNETVDLLALRRNGVYIIDTPFWIERKLTRNPLFWLEEMKCRAINGVAILTPLFKRSSPVPGK